MKENIKEYTGGTGGRLVTNEVSTLICASK